MANPGSSLRFDTHLLDWFEVDLGFTELLFIQIDLCVMCVFVLYSPISLSSCGISTPPFSQVGLLPQLKFFLKKRARTWKNNKKCIHQHLVSAEATRNFWNKITK